MPDPLVPLGMLTPIVINQSPDAWLVALNVVATLGGALVGALVGAWYGGKKGYEASLKAGLHITRQSKLEECLSLIYQLENACRDQLKEASNELKRGAVVPAQQKWKEIDLDTFSRDAALLRSLIRLHAKRLSEDVEELAKCVFFIDGFRPHLNRLSSQSNQEDVKNHSDVLSEMCSGVLRHCSLLRTELEKEATTED